MTRDFFEDTEIPEAFQIPDRNAPPTVFFTEEVPEDCYDFMPKDVGITTRDYSFRTYKRAEAAFYAIKEINPNALQTFGDTLKRIKGEDKDFKTLRYCNKVIEVIRKNIDGLERLIG